MADVEAFKNHLIDAGVLDPDGVHHSFKNGYHGQKLDFDKIPDGSELYNEWTLNVADHIQNQFPNPPEIVVGVAEGANRIALSAAKKLGGKVLGAVSKKNLIDYKRLYIPAATFMLIHRTSPKLVIVIEDVGTTGANAAQIATHAARAGAKKVAVVTTWQRRERLERLEEAGVRYSTVINEPIPTYTKEACEAGGYCADNWELL